MYGKVLLLLTKEKGKNRKGKKVRQETRKAK